MNLKLIASLARLNQKKNAGLSGPGFHSILSICQRFQMDGNKQIPKVFLRTGNYLETS